MDPARLVENLDPHDPAFGEDGSLEAAMSELRARCPIAHTDAHGGAHLLVNYDDVVRVAQDWRTFSSADGILIPRSDNAVPMIPGEYDPPLQRSYRQALNPLLTRHAVERYVPGMHAEARRLLAALEGKKRTDIVAAFSDPYPRQVFFRHVLGVPPEDIPEVLGYIFAIKEPKSAEEAGQAWIGFTAYVSAMYERRREQGGAANGQEDLLDGVLAAKVDGRPLTDDEAVRALMQLTFGGLGTTAAALANMIRRLGENPDLQARVRADRTLLPQAIEELLRFDTIAITMARTATCDTALGGVPVAAGDKALIYFAGANRDPDEFDEPDRIDIDRPVNRHLTFGAGPHRCIGSNLARRQIMVALSEVLDHLDEIAVAPGQELHFHSGFSRGLDRLDITYTYRGR